MKIKNLIAVTALALGTAVVAHADPINGSIGIGAGASWTPGGDVITFPVTFTDQNGPHSQGVVTSTSGDFAAVPMLSTVNMVSSFDYSVGTFATPVSLFTGQDFSSLALDNVISETVATDSTTGAQTLTIIGMGTLGLEGFDPTAGTYTITSSITGSAISFEATATSNSPVPEPESLALLGTGLLGVVGVARRKFNV